MDKKTREQAIEELSLMLMYLTRFQDDNEFCRYMETSWKGYDFDALNELEKKDLIYQPKKSKCVYLSEEGKVKARELLAEYHISDKDILEKFEFRNIRPEEAEQAVAIEQICFPPNEACSEKNMKERIAVATELFLVAVDRETGKLAGFLNGLSTDEYSFRDEFFVNADLHNPEGKNIMLLGLDVLPEYRRQGLARELVFQYLRREREKDRRRVILTCLKSKVKMYRKLGFTDHGISDSTWGGEEWHEMSQVIGIG
ncbi:MAG: GNAT family N-acetyltransferase [Lachnospiraceae bacterium]|nr:GNAT family N-acetyltransferase [Lachnospiraceae bacterium]